MGGYKLFLSCGCPAFHGIGFYTRGTLTVSGTARRAIPHACPRGTAVDWPPDNLRAFPRPRCFLGLGHATWKNYYFWLHFVPVNILLLTVTLGQISPCSLRFTSAKRHDSVSFPSSLFMKWKKICRLFLLLKHCLATPQIDQSIPT